MTGKAKGEIGAKVRPRKETATARCLCGGVEIEAEGESAPLGTLVARVRQGPGRARIDSVDERWGEGPPRMRGFGIRHEP